MWSMNIQNFGASVPGFFVFFFKVQCSRLVLNGCYDASEIYASEVEYW